MAMRKKPTTKKKPRRGDRGTPPPASGATAPAATPRAAAQTLLKEVVGALRIHADLRDLKFDKVLKSPLGSHVLFQQYHHGRPITGAWVKVSVDKQNRPFDLTHSLIPVAWLAKSEVRSREAALPEQQAKLKAMKAVRTDTARLHGPISSELVYFPVGHGVHPAWKFLMPTIAPRRDWRIYVDAQTGKVLEKENMLKKVVAVGRVFDPNPVVVLDDTSLRDKRAIPTRAYVDVRLPGVDGSGRLDGPYVSTRETRARVKVDNGDFRFTRDRPGFTEVMAYFHIDRVQRYLQKLGFRNVNRRSIGVDVAVNDEDQSQYSPITKTLSFGTGKVDDAEDAEIILHEYGHAIQDDQVPGFGRMPETGAMGEGFGDYWAASFFDDAKPERLRNCIGSWDAVAYSKDDPPCLRRLDSGKHYPEDFKGENVHQDGEIWSACLWQIRTVMGRKAADTLIIGHHFLLKRDATFEDAVDALIKTDQQLNGGANEAAIRSIFVRRGIIAGRGSAARVAA